MIDPVEHGAHRLRVGGPEVGATGRLRDGGQRLLVEIGADQLVDRLDLAGQGVLLLHGNGHSAAASDAEAARKIVAAEVANYLTGQRMAEVTPTVTALRQRAADVVEAELLRLDNRLPGLDAAYRDEVAKTVRRVVDKLLHAPTVRVKQLANAPGGDSYAEALRELFELDQQAVDAVAAGELPLVTTDLDKTE